MISHPDLTRLLEEGQMKEKRYPVISGVGICRLRLETNNIYNVELTIYFYLCML